MGEASRKAARKAKPVYWIASYPRSGNTWLRAFLQALLAVVRGEDVSSPDINRLTECSTWETKATPFERVIGKPIQAMSWQEITAARPKVQGTGNFGAVGDRVSRSLRRRREQQPGNRSEKRSSAEFHSTTSRTMSDYFTGYPGVAFTSAICLSCRSVCRGT